MKLKSLLFLSKYEGKIIRISFEGIEVFGKLQIVAADGIVVDGAQILWEEKKISRIIDMGGAVLFNNKQGGMELWQ